MDFTSAIVPNRPRRAWREALLALALSILFPGAGHVFAASAIRGCLWSVAYLAIVLPGSIFLYIGLSSPGSGVHLGVASFLLSFLLLGSVGPVRKALWAGPTQPRPRRPLWLLEGYAALVALGVTVEIEWFLRNCFATKTVETSCLAPFAGPGDRLTVLLSRYVRPVHGDLLLCRPLQASGDDCSLQVALLRARLGLVLAKAGDTIRASQGKLYVNSLELDLKRSDQRFDLERAGRRESRRRFFAPLRLAGIVSGQNPVEPSRAALDSALAWGVADWGPFVVPRGFCYMLLDEGECSPETPEHRGVFVQKAYIAGRAID